MPDNNGTVHIEQHIYKSEIAQEDEYYEDEKEAKRNIENRKHLVFIQNLPNEKRIALENAHKKWDTGVTYDMKEGNSEYINFLEEMWLTLSEFYTSRNFSGKTSKQYINDYIKERFDYHSSKHIINGEFLGGSMQNVMIGGDVIHDMEELIQDVVATFNLYTEDFNYDDWVNEWNVDYDTDGNII